MDTNQLSKLKKQLQNPLDIVIIPHKNPDGDAIGACLAVFHYLSILGHRPIVVSPNRYPAFLKWLPGQDQILQYEYQPQKGSRKIAEATLLFTLDFNHLSRVDALQPVLEKATATVVMIDHHEQPDSYADYMYSDPSMSSTCEMVYHWIEKMGHRNYITPEIASCLYTGIMTDTGSFRYQSTTSTTHRVLAELIDRGAVHHQIHENVYDNQRLQRLRLQGVALRNLVILEEYHVAYISISQQELADHDFQKGDTDGFVNIGLSVTGVKLALIFIENKSENCIKISLRSKGNFSVNQMARDHFDGGGHRNAAGGKSNLSMQQTIAKFISILPLYKEVLCA